MSLIYCPECGHETSNAAVACPNCGRPINAVQPTIERNVIVAQPRKEGFAPWMFVPIGILGVVLLFILFYAMSRDDETANSNLAVNVRTRGTTASDTTRDSIDVPRTQTSTVNVPPATDTQTTNIPGSQTTITAPPPDKGTVVIEAKIQNRTGTPTAVKNEKFYLLDRDLESILSSADLESMDGQSLLNSFGLSIVYPERFGEFSRGALRAIKDHIKYSGQTDSSGKAQLGGVEPGSYYLFGITKSGSGFAIWSSPVTVINGENRLNLAPQRVTELNTSG